MGVHKPVNPCTPAVHALLRHLEEVGFASAPRVLGIDDEGRQVLSYLEGETVGTAVPWPAWVFSDDALTQVGAWLRSLHEATKSFVPPPDAIWFAGPPWRPGMVIAHNDAGPHNAVWRDGKLAGFIDWDTAGPSTGELDLAFAALSWVPLHARRAVVALGFTDFDDRHRRLHLLLDAYGFIGERLAFGQTVARRARLNAAGIEQMAATGDSAGVALLPFAADLAEAAKEVEQLPAEFWRR